MSRTLDRATVLGPRALAIQKRFEVPILVASLLVVPVIVIEEQASSSGLRSAAHMLNWLIWAVFLAELVALFEQYDMPGGLKTDANGIAEMDGEKGAWFKDPEGNILVLGNRSDLN